MPRPRELQTPAGLGDRFIVRPGSSGYLIGVQVQFQISARRTKNLAVTVVRYVMVSIETARAVRLPEDIRAKYEI